LFPTRIVVNPLRVSRVKKRWFGSNEESISIPNRFGENFDGDFLVRRSD